MRSIKITVVTFSGRRLLVTRHVRRAADWASVAEIAAATGDALSKQVVHIN